MAARLSFLVVLSFVILSCQQDHEIAVPADPDPPIPTPEVSLVKTSSLGDEKTIYSYDPMNRQILAEYSDGYTTCTYSGDVVIIRYFSPDSILQSFTTMEINTDSLVGRRTVSNNASYTEWYEYNAEGQILKTRAVNGADEFINVYAYTNGNLDSTTYYKNGQWRYTYIYSYYTAHLNTLDYDAFGQAYRGSASKNLIKQWFGRKPSGETFIQVSFTYTFDAKDRVATQTQIMNDNISTFSYTYLE